MTTKEALLAINITARAAESTSTMIGQGAKIIRYKKGKYIFCDKDDTEAIYGVVDGTVAIYKLSTLDEKRGMFIFGAGAILNEDSLDGKPASTDAEALCDSIMLVIQKNVFQSACARDAELSEAVIESLAMKVRRLYHLMKNTSNNLRGDKRIAAKLWKLSRDHGIKTERGTEINFDLTITTLAEFLGSQRETVSRQVKTLTDAGLLIVQNSRFIIPDREKLLHFFREF